MNGRWMLVPVIEPMDPRRCNVFEHTPLSYYRYGEYPRDLNPVGGHPPRSDWKFVGAKTSLSSEK